MLKVLATVSNLAIKMLRVAIPPLVALKIPFGNVLTDMLTKLKETDSVCTCGFFRIVVALSLAWVQETLFTHFFGWYLKKNNIQLKKCRDSMNLNGEHRDGMQGPEMGCSARQ